MPLSRRTEQRSIRNRRTSAPGELEEKFFYSMDAGSTLENGKEWCVTVTRTMEALYQATLTYTVRILFRSKKAHQDDDYQSPLEYALNLIAERASFVLSALTFDSFITPLSRLHFSTTENERSDIGLARFYAEISVDFLA